MPAGANCAWCPAFIATAFARPHHTTANAEWRLVADRMRGTLPRLATLMDGAEKDVLGCMTFPRQHCTKLQSTNLIERRNRKIKMRADVVGTLSSEAAIRRLAGAISMEQTEEWTGQRGRYVTMEPEVREVKPRHRSATIPSAACLPRRQTE